MHAWPAGPGSRTPLVAVLVVLVVAACGGQGVPSSTPDGRSPAPLTAAPATPAATPSPRPTVRLPTVRLDEVLVLADGRNIDARCIGEGTPTILLEVGGSNDMTNWSTQFVNELGAATTTCLYSRAGGRGSSAPAHRPVSMEDVTSDAFEVLELAKAKAGVEGPYVFVGWSLGGSVALGNALARPDQTVGMAILDSGLPQDFMKNCAADGRSLDDCQAEFDEDIDAKFFEAQIAEVTHPLDIPAVLVTAMSYPECVDSPSATLSANLSGTTVVAADCRSLAEVIADAQFEAWVGVLPEISETRIAASHDRMTETNAEEIAALVLQVVEAARAAG